MQVRFGGEPLGHTETCYLIKRKMDIDTISSTLALWVLVLVSCLVVYLHDTHEIPISATLCGRDTTSSLLD